MGQLMLINPAKRPAKRRRKATPAQLRALAKARKARMATNPAPRRRRPSMRAVARATRRRVRRNPIGMTGLMGDIMGAVQGAGGALAVNAVYRLLPLPLALTTGKAAPAAVKMGLAVALGTFGRKFLGRTAGKMAEGAMTVTAYDLIASMVPATFGGSALPASTVKGLGYLSPGLDAGATSALTNQSIDGMGEYVSGMGEYVSGVGEYTYDGDEF